MMVPQKRKRGYSREFSPHGQTGKRYILDQIPAGFWAEVRKQASADGVSLRNLILTLLREWLQTRTRDMKKDDGS